MHCFTMSKTFIVVPSDWLHLQDRCSQISSLVCTVNSIEQGQHFKKWCIWPSSVGDQLWLLTQWFFIEQVFPQLPEIQLQAANSWSLLYSRNLGSMIDDRGLRLKTTKLYLQHKRYGQNQTGRSAVIVKDTTTSIVHPASLYPYLLLQKVLWSSQPTDIQILFKGFPLRKWKLRAVQEDEHRRKLRNWLVFCLLVTQASCRLPPSTKKTLRIGLGSALGTSLRFPFSCLPFESLVRIHVVSRLVADTRVRVRVLKL